MDEPTQEKPKRKKYANSGIQLVKCTKCPEIAPIHRSGLCRTCRIVICVDCGISAQTSYQYASVNKRCAKCDRAYKRKAVSRGHD